MSVLSFLHTDSEMTRLMRTFDWSSTTLGAQENWPENLKAKLNTIMHSAFPMFLFWGADLICFYNDAFRPILGKDGKHPALGKKAKDVWPEIWDSLAPTINQVMVTGEPIWFEDRLVPFYRNGKIEDVYLTSSYSAVTDGDNNIVGVVVICTETTEKVNLVKQLTESNRLYAFAIDASELGTWDLDPSTNKFVANARLKDWFGLGHEEEIDLSAAIDGIAEKDRKRVTKAIESVLTYGGNNNYDITYTLVNRTTGHERIVRAKGKALFDQNSKPYSFNGTLQDITTETSALEQNQQLSILVENSVDLMAILKMDGKNAYINAAGKELLGVDPLADVTQIPIADFHTPEQLEYVASEIIPNVLSHGKWSGQFGIRNCKTGEIIPLYNNCHRIDDERTGAVIGIGAVMRDMRAELNARQNLENEVRERTKELLKLNQELQQKNSDLASFAFVSSHDLQEPLRKIQTFISRIESNKQGAPEVNNYYFERIKTSAGRMQQLITDLLSFSHISSVEEKQFEECDLNALLQIIIENFQEQLTQLNGIIIYNNLPIIKAIPFQISQIFTNLIINSIKFSKSDTPLRITIEASISKEELPDAADNSAQFYKIAFSDNGIGFDPQYSKKIFEVFQRLHSRDSYEGSGIGLSICKRIMDHHSGYITATGKPNEGAVFNLFFPV